MCAHLVVCEQTASYCLVLQSVILQCVGGDASVCVRGCVCDAIIDPALDNSAIATTAAIKRNLLITGAMAIASKRVIWH